MTPGDVFRHLETGDVLTLEKLTEDGQFAAVFWFDASPEYRWSHVAVKLLIPLLGSQWPME